MLPGIDTNVLHNLDSLSPATAVIELWQTEAYSNMQFNKRMTREYNRKAREAEKAKQEQKLGSVPELQQAETGATEAGRGGGSEAATGTGSNGGEGSSGAGKARKHKLVWDSAVVDRPTHGHDEGAGRGDGHTRG